MKRSRYHGAMNMITDRQSIEDVFERGTVVEVFPSKQELIEELVGGKRLKIYIGLDPTAPALHLGHAKNLIFLEDLRQLGHQVIVLFGDFTAQIGDPTDKNSVRAQLSEKQIKNNIKDWTSQIKPLMGFEDKKNPVQIKFN